MLHNIDLKKYEELIQSNENAKEIIDQLLDNHKQIVSTISHEIRNPLSLVYSRLQLMESTHPDITTYKSWNSIVEDIDYMKQLLEELSSFNNSDYVRKDTIDMSDFFKRLALSFAISLESTSYIFSSEISSYLPNFTGDKIKLQEVFLNILRNAQESLQEDGFIKLCVNYYAPNIVITISDSGCGIDPVYIDTIFDMFQTYKTGGTGLGLAISQNIIKAHNGTISVDSQVNIGTTFTISLPTPNSFCD